MATVLASRAALVLPTPGQQQHRRPVLVRLPRPDAAGLATGWSSFFCAPPQFSARPVVRIQNRQVGVARAAWTRKSKSALDPPSNKRSWKQRHEKFLKPFMLDVFISHKYIHAKVMHRVTSRVVSVATTNAKELRFSLQSLTDDNACKTVGKLLAERSIEADVFAVKFDLRKNEKFEGKLALVVNTMVEHGIVVV
ncbi:large subunit ribosomal protein L18 [Marchantia polymorpha subsp. ruderalis]|uniref:Uncharacterized protein n=2 Tax=Marchantia polymorpha TaxID=3197 RepID=A0A176WDN3_MARPO|nr:hypothetical protein AXG93_4295s1920 [Marchantia polymorpha subsp. ruderalis]PTQ37564.1 hypothetical protein MARPO_0056s0039 [Marchantia polymorpha]BBN14882.1 hypothetical protein Mp_6g15290 [Marchantia polymorpha subsp. ruderalis]|eukprot:PTQ37564.1 hypothetical protein MARPO_0056s0039 [Marchantia polymorpha]